MGLDSCMKCIKYALFIFNFIFWLIGVVLLGFGLYILINPMINKAFFDQADYNDVVHKISLAIIILGSIIMLLGFLGCCGSILENKCMLLVFFVLMTLIFLVVLVGGLVLVFMKNQVIEKAAVAFDRDMMNLTANYKLPNPDEKRINITDTYHRHFRCCGSKGPSDFSDDTSQVPASCKEDGRVFQSGCTEKLKEYLGKYWLKTIIAIFTTAFVTLIGMIFSMLLCCALRDDYD